MVKTQSKYRHSTSNRNQKEEKGNESQSHFICMNLTQATDLGMRLCKQQELFRHSQSILSLHEPDMSFISGFEQEACYFEADMGHSSITLDSIHVA